MTADRKQYYSNFHHFFALRDELLRILYPGYEDSSYFHDERGFIAPTPYGDIADCLLSDAEGWLLRRYAVLVITGGLEIQDKLLAYVADGGHLVITAANLAKFPKGIGGGCCLRFATTSLRSFSDYPDNSQGHRRTGL